MLSIIMMTIFMSMSVFSMIMLSPLTLGMTILIMAMATSLMFSILNSSWMAFLIFLIYISGTLIMFSYFVAMTPNMTITLPTQMPLILITPPMIMLILYMSKYHQYLSSYTQNMNTFYSINFMSLLVIMVILLLFTMVIVVKICSLTKGPLRPFN